MQKSTLSGMLSLLLVSGGCSREDAPSYTLYGGSRLEAGAAAQWATFDSSRSVKDGQISINQQRCEAVATVLNERISRQGETKSGAFWCQMVAHRE